MNIELISALVLFGFVSSITPGPNNLMLMASGTNYGFSRSVPHLLGVSGGFTLMIVLVGAGLIQVFEAWPMSYLVLKSVSVMYLVYLAWKIANAAGPDEDAAATNRPSQPLTFIQAALFQWVNPKAWAMALTAISVYTFAGDTLYGVGLVAAVFGAINLPSCSSWVVLGTQLRRFLTNPQRLRMFNYSAAFLLLASLYPILLG